MQKRLERIIKQYKTLKEKYPDRVIENVLEQKNLETAVLVSAISEDKDGKLHNHQHRVGREKLEIFTSKLEEKIEEIKKAVNFDQIYRVVDTIKIKGVGMLTKYDIALRIGFYKNMLPDKVYLHSGAKVGAEMLLKRKISKRYIERNELIEPLKSADVENWELEDILCIFKGKFT